ncbi:MAG: hypothetical protein H8K10_07500 [Nitrospira sp.]|nr:hypothetical protein [Nitrospira sp.]
MDHRTSAIEQGLRDIAQTRIAIAEKLDVLEQRITHRVEDVTMTCSDMLNRATDNIGAFVNKTKAVVDPAQHIDRHPWLMLGGALCAGYAIGLIEQGSKHQRGGVYPHYPPGVRGPRVMPAPAQRHAKSKQAEGVYDYYPHESQSSVGRPDGHGSSLWSSLSREFGHDTEETKHMVLQVGRTLLFELARKAMPEIARALGMNLTVLTPEDEHPSRTQTSLNKGADGGNRRGNDAQQPVHST